MSNRIAYIDGHRGLAILLVIGFHAYTRWPGYVPYGDRFADIPFFQAGWLGVQLFFLVSGFVILMTLEKCSGIKEFVFRRWIRLFPAMLICSALIFTSATYFYERPAGMPSVGSLLPGLTFIEPAWWKMAFGFPERALEGAFWSLYVEFKFYIFSAFIYFMLGEKKLILLLVICFILALLVGNLSVNSDDKVLALLKIIVSIFSFKYFGWFAGGAMFYLYAKKSCLKWFYGALSICILSSIFVSTVLISELSWKPVLAACLISVFFAMSLVNPKIQGFLNSRLLLFFGFVSYPLYLIHENMMISMIVKLSSVFEIPQILYPVLPVLLLSAVAYIIASYGEGYVKKLLSTVRNI